MVIFTMNIRVRLSHLRTTTMTVVVSFSWHQVINVGSVRVLYVTINHRVVKRNLYTFIRSHCE